MRRLTTGSESGAIYTGPAISSWTPRPKNGPSRSRGGVGPARSSASTRRYPGPIAFSDQLLGGYRPYEGQKPGRTSGLQAGRPCESRGNAGSGDDPRG